MHLAGLASSQVLRLNNKCRKIPKISLRAYIFQRPFLRGLFSEGLIFEGLYMYGGKFAFQNRLGQLVVERKFTIFALFYFVFEGKFQVQAPQGAYIQRGDLTEGFLRYDFGGLIFGGAYTWRGLFSEFYGILKNLIQNYIIITIKGLKTPNCWIQPVGYLQVWLRKSIGAGDKLVLRSLKPGLCHSKETL